MAQNDLSERDLLIELRAEFRAFKEFVSQELKEIKQASLAHTNNYDVLETRVTRCEGQVQKNTALRKWIYSSLVTGLVAAVMGAISIFGH